jgi:pimeloyl-ACP methyl ester carboxylesterase
LIEYAPVVDKHGNGQTVNLAYERRGPRSGETIVLIRGLGTQLIEWPEELLTELVDAGLDVVVFDNRDAGLSTKMDDVYELKAMAGDVVGLLDHLDVASAHIFGISLGGMVAQLVACYHPSRTKTLFSVMSHSGNPEVVLIHPEAAQYLVEQASDRDGIIRETAMSRLHFGSVGYPESAAVRLQAATAAYDRCYCPEGSARQMEAVRRDGSRVDRLKAIRVPTLVIHGADDPLVALSGGQDTARHIPGAELVVIRGMGHNIPAALGGEIARHIISFTRKQTQQ